jgi:UDP-glucose 4-epimerase
MRVLITGGAGFIGSHLAHKFETLGDEVTVFDNLTTGSAKNLKTFNGQFVQGDIRDFKAIDNLISNSDVVLHMAAALGVEKIMQDPIESISVNIQGSEVVLKSAAMHKKRILIASTSEVYGKNPKQPLSEGDDRVIGTPQNIRWSYSDAKAIEEAMARALNLQQDLPVTTVRFFNTVGPKQTGQYGMVVPRFVEAALKDEDIVIFGDGTQSRVFCHVEDAVSGVMALLTEPASIGEVFNIGGVGEVSMNELASTVIEVTGSKSQVKYKSYADAYPVGYEDMQRRVPDTTKLRNLTGWSASHNLKSIISDVAKYLA